VATFKGMFIVAFEKDGLNKKKETYDGS